MASSAQSVKQLPLPIFDSSRSLHPLSGVRAEERGAVFTRREVVEFILDLSGYITDRPLHRYRLLEPSFGNGDFLLPVVERLLSAYKMCVSDLSRIAGDISEAIRAVEVHAESIEKTRARLTSVLQAEGVPAREVSSLLDAWIVKGDFLLVELPWMFTHAVGNPPYVRQELIPDALLADYRARYRTIYDRADLYVPFIERCLGRLEPGGVLGFICSDRWMKNKYGGPLRAMVADRYHLTHYVDMVNTPAFRSDVIAYPAITIIRRSKPGVTRIAHRPQVDAETLTDLAKALQADDIPKESGVVEVSDVTKGSDPWILHSFDQLDVVRRLEEDFPSLKDAGCSVGIGVATGADGVFIVPFKSADIEPDRKLPLVKTSDIKDGTISWQGLAVINPFSENGSLVSLAKYPRLARHLERHADVLRKRHCAKKKPKAWYRTIDRIYPELTYRPKLLIPDIKGEANVVYEDGHFYPHHNLYYITSEEWDLKALQAVLRSGIAKLFVSVYSTHMRGGYLRFQAQYLRRIRLPRWSDVPEATRTALVKAASVNDTEACSKATFDLYQLSSRERAAIGGNGG